MKLRNYQEIMWAVAGAVVILVAAFIYASLSGCATASRMVLGGPPPSFAPPLHTLPLNGPALPCTLANPVSSTTWTNTLGHPIAVVGGHLWVGVDKDTIADVNVAVSNQTTGDIYLDTNEDHYASRTCVGCSDLDFGMPPYWWLVNAGDQLQVRLSCRGPYPPSVGGSAGTMLFMQYLSLPS